MVTDRSKRSVYQLNSRRKLKLLTPNQRLPCTAKNQGHKILCPYEKIQDYQDAINLKNKRDRSERLHSCDFVARINVNNLSRNPTR